MLKHLKLRAAGASFALALAATTPTQAAVIQLGFIVDESGSISGSEFNIIRTGLANAINTLIPIGGPDTYEISVVKFDNDAETVVNRQLVTTVAERSAVATLVASMSQEGNTTNYTAAFGLMYNLLTGSPNFSAAGLTYVNFATDGAPNPASANGITERNAMIAAGIDNISIEGIGVTAAAATFLQTSICHPGPCDLTSPYDFPAHGFYIGVANATEYAAAIGTKIRLVTNQVPEPGTMALFGAALLGFGFARRRKV